MKDLDVFLNELRALGVKLWVEGDKLKLRAPEGAMTPALTAALRERKAEILALLRPEPGHAIPPAPVADSYAVSAAQRRLWVLAQFPDASTAYNIPLHQFLEGPLEASALAAAFVRLVARHESLRTTFAVIDGEPRQVVHGYFGNEGRSEGRSGFSPTLAEARAEARPTECEGQPTKCRAEARPTGELLEYRDLSGRADPDARARQLGREESARAFDLAAGPLFRAILLKLAEERHVLLFTIHHIIADGVSLGVLARDLSRLYEAARTGVPDGLPPLRIGYPAYAAWQNRQLQSETMAAHRRFWLEQLGGELPVLNLPLDFPRPPVQTFQGRELSFKLPPARLDALNAFCRARNASLFMALHAVLKALLYAYTGQEDIIVGCPVAGRDHADLADQIGFYLNTLALRTRVDGAASFEDFFGHVAAATKAAFDHRVYPFDQLLGELKLSRDPSRFPLFDVLLVLQNQDEPGLGMGGLRAGSVFEHPETSKFDLTFTCKATPAGLVLGIEYNIDLFREERIERMGGHFLNLIESVLADPRRAVGRLNLLGAAERRQVLDEFNRTGRAYPRDRSLPDLLEAAAAAHPDAVALQCNGRALTYRELHGRANRLAGQLQALGVGPGVPVGLHVARSPALVIGALGILKAGGAYVPMDPAYPQERLAYMVEDAGLAVLVGDAATADGAFPGVRRVPLDSEAACDPSLSAPPRQVGPEHPAYLIYTSGSTGKPKGVSIPHRALVNFLLSMAERPGLDAADTLLAVTSISFDIAGLELYLPLLRGARVVLADSAATADGRRLLALLDESRATLMQATPATWRMLLDAGWQRDSLAAPLKALCGGEALAGDLAEALLGRCGEVWNLYGPTETTVWSTVEKLAPAPGGRREAVESIGRPIANTRIYLLNAQRQPVPLGVPGDLYIGGDGLALGYANRPELTAERFVDVAIEGAIPPVARLYKTGDTARYRADGRLEFLGRADEQIKLRGFRIELGEIETVLAAHPAIEQAVAAVRRQGSGDPYLVAWYLGAELAANELREHLQRQLPQYMIPSRFHRVAAFPLTPNGKIDRRALTEPDWDAARASAHVPPRTEWERRLARLWEEILQAPRVGIHDNFFELGGHSLKATAFVAALQKDGGVALGLIDVFQRPTVAELARLAEGMAAERTGWESIRPVDEDLGILPATAEELEWLNQL